MRTRKLLSGLGAAVMSLMMIIPWAVYADSPQVEDSSIVTESSAAEAMAEQGVIKAQKNSTQNTETDWVLFSSSMSMLACALSIRDNTSPMPKIRLAIRCGGSAYNDRAYG